MAGKELMARLWAMAAATRAAPAKMDSKRILIEVWGWWCGWIKVLVWVVVVLVVILRRAMQ